MDDETATLFPDSFEDSELGEIPKGWKISSIGDEYRVVMGQSPPGETYNNRGEGTPFFQGSTDFGFRYPFPRVYCTDPRRFAEERDTLVSVRAPVGDINMAKTRCCIGRGLASIRHHSECSTFTYQSIFSIRPDLAQFEADGTVFGSISGNDLKAVRMAIPPLPLIKKFEELAHPLDKMIEINDDQTSTLTSIRDLLLPKLISGEIRLPQFRERGEQ
jgi:type I restriction enzyme S subunit